MEAGDIFNALYYKELNDVNLETQLQKFNELINKDFRDIVESSFKAGFQEGEKMARANERLMLKGKIVGNLFVNTDMTDDEIYKIVGLGEEKWIEYIKYLRGQYEKGKNEGKRKAEMKLLIYSITERYGDLSEKIKKALENMKYESLKEKFDTAESSEEFIEILWLNDNENKW
ncbi:hypothetical protein [Clostridium sp. JS66]|uniref:hypothetical protein n=1 Tax=Clostridium sp. JS66 TaxID=3064705 RepID=UPI00298EB63D|nr:hypothetical protein [Clostridium sp. JS66]WPC42828.1 hypothetical protein Q6H37_04985 [Clostridium sp. JS66]